jgi:phthiocerol/phenolphthiocerol synthesis type-I polyketide synthase E
MAVDATIPEGLRAGVQDHALAAGLSNEQGVDAFRRILGHRTDCQVAMSSRNLVALLEGSRAARVAPSGDRSRASSPDGAAATHHPRPSLQSAFVGPRTGVEERICQIWQENLGIDRVGIDDNFFELGGHSLLAVRVMTLINDDLGTEIPIATLYEGLTVRFLAGHVERPAEHGEPDTNAYLAERRRDKVHKQKEHQQRRKALLRRHRA